MATLVLAAVGLPAGIGQLATFGISAAAAYVDAALIFPALFPPPEPKGPRVNGFEVQHAEEGAPANRLFGKENRVAGTVIWAGALRMREDTSRGSKGGGRGGDFVRYKYYRNVAVEIGRLKRGKTYKRIKRVTANGKPFFDPEGIGSVTSDKIRAVPEAFYSHRGQGGYRYYLRLISNESAGGPDLTQFQTGQFVTLAGFSDGTHPLASPLRVDVETTGADPTFANGNTDQFVFVAVTGTGMLSVKDTLTINAIVYTIQAVVPPLVSIQGDNEANDIREGINVFQAISFTGTPTVPEMAHIRVTPNLNANLTDGLDATPASNAGDNNGSWVVSSVGRTSIGESYMVVYDHVNVTVSQTFCGRDAGQSITITQEDRTFPETLAKEVRFYYGSNSQSQDISLVTELADACGGASNVPAFRGRAVMVVEDLELTDSNNILPNFEFDVEPEDDFTLRTSIGEMLQDANMPPSDYDLSLIPTDLLLGGFTYRGVQNMKASLQPLLLGFHLLSQQTERLRLFPRTSATLIDVTGKTVAFAPGEDVSRPAKFSQLGDGQSQQYAFVKFFDAENKLQVGRKKAVGAVKLSSRSQVFDTNMTMTGDEAQKLANTLFELSRTSGRRGVLITLPPSYISTVRESVRLRLTRFGQTRDYLVLRVDLGADFVMRCECVEDDLEAFTQTATSEGRVS